MHKVFKPQNIVKSEQIVKIPDMIIPSFEPEVFDGDDICQIAKKNVDNPEEVQKIFSEKYEQMLEKARVECENLKEQANKDFDIEKNKIIDEANIEAQKIIDDAKVQAEDILTKSKEDAQDIISKAYDEGFNKGITEKRENLEKLVSAISDTMTQMQTHYSQFCREYEKELMYLSVDIVEKLLNKKIGEDELILLDMIKQTLKSIRDAGWITVEISENLPALAKALNEQVKLIGMEQQVEIEMSNDVSDDTCVLRAQDRLVDASLMTQLENIREYFKKCDKSDE